MKIPLKWLSEYVDLTGVSAEKLSEVLTMSGTENEIVKEGATFPGVVVGEIKEIKKHENADKLQVTKTDVGKANGGMLQIVCGAPNIAVGQKVPVALVGADLGEFRIKEAEIRGVKSFGMLCSESELGISDDHSGIMVLDARAKVGEPLSDALNIGGIVLEAEITPNRGDCLSIIGVAREAAAALGRKVRGVNFKTVEARAGGKVEVEILEKDLCPRYIAKAVTGVKIGPSPKWMQERLSAAGVRPISNIVDVTNYVMLEWGQPLHAFDGDKVNGKIIVRKAKAGEKHTTLDGVERKLNTTDLVIADKKDIIGLAGVMGGLNSEVTEDTKTVILEAAVFNRTSIRKTAQRLGLRSEASNRFEKGIPMRLPEVAIERAAGLLVATGGGKAGEKTDVLSKWIWTQRVGIRLSRLSNSLGVTLPTEKIIGILTSLGFEAEVFDIKKEARKHVGKPYVFGASFKTHGDMAFDCSYLSDYIYSRIGKFIGHTSLGQYELGKEVKTGDLLPGDLLFMKGRMDKQATDHYFVPDGKGGHKKVMLGEPKEVGHCAIYIGDGRIIHARLYEYDKKSGRWKKLAKGVVVEEDVDSFTQKPEYLGARRYILNPEDYVAVTVPWWRLDVSIEEDLIEEIGRIYGYEKLTSRLPGGELPVFEDNPLLALNGEIKDILLGAGFSEVYNYSFISEKQLTSIGDNPKEALKIANPINPEQEYLRLSLTPSLLTDAVLNQDNYADFSIYEIASVYEPRKDDLPNEKQVWGSLVRTTEKNSTMAYFRLKGAIELVAKKLNLGSLGFKKEEYSFLKKGQSASVYLSGKKIGYLGIISDRIQHGYGLKTPVAVAELKTKGMLSDFGKVKKYQSISRFPTAVRDINFILPESISAQEILQKLGKLSIKELSTFEIIDIYEGGNLSAGEKSVTIRLVFSAGERTLKDDEVLSYLKEVVAVMKKKFGATQRI